MKRLGGHFHSNLREQVINSLRVASYTDLYGYTESVPARYGFCTDFNPYICIYGFFRKLNGFCKYTEFLWYGFFAYTDFYQNYTDFSNIRIFFPDTDFFCIYGFLPKLYGFLKYTDFFPDTDFFLHIRISTKLYGFIRIFDADFFRKLYGLYGFFSFWKLVTL